MNSVTEFPNHAFHSQTAQACFTYYTCKKCRMQLRMVGATVGIEKTLKGSSMF